MDEEIRLLERDAIADDLDARARLTIARLRSQSGVVWVWVARDTGGRFGVDIATNRILVNEETPTGPPGTVEVTLVGFASGGEMTLSGVDTQPPPEKRAWALACLNVSDAMFGMEPTPQGTDVMGPGLLDLATGRLSFFGVTKDVSLSVGQDEP